MKTKTKTKNLLSKLTTYLMVLITIFGTFMTNSTTVLASELVLNEQTGYSYTGVSPHLSYPITHDNIFVNNEEPTNHFEVKNVLKKGTAELTKKDVSTGELLPNTDIRILDEEKNTIAEGRTDDKGIYTFEKLPAGKYYFQEYDAPTGYQLDDTPMQFEITENVEILKCEMTNKKINKNESMPQTGNTTNTAIFALGLVLSVSALGVLYFRRKKAKVE